MKHHEDLTPTGSSRKILSMTANQISRSLGSTPNKNLSSRGISLPSQSDPRLGQSPSIGFAPISPQDPDRGRSSDRSASAVTLDAVRASDVLAQSPGRQPAYSLLKCSISRLTRPQFTFATFPKPLIYRVLTVSNLNKIFFATNRTNHQPLINL